MKILTKKDVKNKLSDYGVFSRKISHQLVNKLTYLAGIPALDELKDKGKFDASTSQILFRRRPLGLEIIIHTGFKKRRFGLYDDKINFWSLEHHDDISVDNSKSVVGKAVLGGMLFGVGGAIVGGASGLVDKADHILTISYNENDKEKVILFSSTSSKSGKVYDYMEKNFGNKYKDPKTLKSEETSEEPADSSNDQFSIADELKKLNDLKESGIISEEEFNDQKEKLLNQ